MSNQIKHKSGQGGNDASAAPIHTPGPPEPDFSPLDFETDEWLDMIYQDPKRLPISTKAQCFHNCDAKGKPVSVNDKRIYKYLTHTQHIITCGNLAYIYKNGYYQEDTDETILKSMIADCLVEVHEKSTTINRVHKLFLQKHELTVRADDMNAYDPWYVNFENGMYNVRTGKMYRHSPKIYSINQIPHEYYPSADHGSGTEIEKFLQFAVPAEDDREMLLEYIGLCLTKDVSQQKMLVIKGEGGTGKSTLINLVQDIVGGRNISNVSLNELTTQRFKPILLMGKLLNSCADLEIDALDDTSMVKKLIGEDYVDGEHKGLRPVSFKNYSKLLFSTNELPMVRNEKTKGLFRRLLILEMNNEPAKQDPDLKNKLRAEIPYLIHISMQALARMYERGKILESEKSIELTKQLRMDSDTVEAFLYECCVVTHNQTDRVDRTTLFDRYVKFCQDYERQAHTKNNLFKAMKNKGFSMVRGKVNRMYAGLILKPEGDTEIDEEGFVHLVEGQQSEFDLI